MAAASAFKLQASSRTSNKSAKQNTLTVIIQANSIYYAVAFPSTFHVFLRVHLRLRNLLRSDSDNPVAATAAAPSRFSYQWEFILQACRVQTFVEA
jgi:hypothetical protein